MFVFLTRRRLTAFLGLLVLGTGCAKKQAETRFDQESFTNDKYRVALCFDLRNDDQPTAGLVLRGGANRTPRKTEQSQTTLLTQPSSAPTPPTPLPTPEPEIEQHIVALPFGSKAAQGDRRILSTWGSYADLTLVTYISRRLSNDTRGIGISPVFGSSSESSRPIESRKDALYLDRSGLERTFLYRYPPSDVDSKRPAELQHLQVALIDAIGVAIPADAKGVEIKDGQTAIPKAEWENGLARFYPANAQTANSRYLEVRYAIAASDRQKLLADIILKLIAVLLVPIIELFLLGPADIFKPRTRKVVLVLGAILQVAILGVLIWFAYSAKGEMAEKALTELPAIIAGAIVTALVLFIKRNPKPAVSS